MHLRQYSDVVADFIDHNVDRAAQAVRETLASSIWIPDSVRPSPPVQPPVAVVAVSRFEQVQDWVARHKILTGVVVVVCGTAVFKGYQKSRSLRKTRRAKKARNGGRTEVVVIAGSPTLPLTKSLSLDMERRGFIVYVVCNAAEDEAMVHAFSRPDIRPLTIDTTDVRASLSSFRDRAVADLKRSPPTRVQPSSVSPATCNHRRPPPRISSRTS